MSNCAFVQENSFVEESSKIGQKKAVRRCVSVIQFKALTLGIQDQELSCLSATPLACDHTNEESGGTV
jgi:hypothetical protein